MVRLVIWDAISCAHYDVILMSTVHRDKKDAFISYIWISDLDE